MKIPRVLIAGTQSGVGKTSVSLALMQALAGAGVRVQAFKVGPDYIDPGYHELVTGRPSHNLDMWMMGREAVETVFYTYAGNGGVPVIEGVMGLFDGFGSRDEKASTAEMAKFLKVPVILVFDSFNEIHKTAALGIGGCSFLEAKPNRFLHAVIGSKLLGMHLRKSPAKI